MLFFPFLTEVKNRAASSCGNLRRSNDTVPGLTMCGPWQCEQIAENSCSPSVNSARVGGACSACGRRTSGTPQQIDAAAITTKARCMQTSRKPARRRCGRLAQKKSLTGEGKHPKRAAGRNLRQPLVTGEQRIDAADATRDGDILDAVLHPRDRLAFDAGAGLELPQLGPVVRIERLEFAGQPAGEHDAAGG